MTNDRWLSASCYDSPFEQFRLKLNIRAVAIVSVAAVAVMTFFIINSIRKIIIFSFINKSLERHH